MGYSFSKVHSICSEYIVQALLTKIAPKMREVLILHIISGLKHRETAVLLNIPLGTVLWRYNEGIKELLKIVNLQRSDILEER